jgi:hypothetical protein
MDAEAQRTAEGQLDMLEKQQVWLVAESFKARSLPKQERARRALEIAVRNEQLGRDLVRWMERWTR